MVTPYLQVRGSSSYLVGPLCKIPQGRVGHRPLKENQHAHQQHQHRCGKDALPPHGTREGAPPFRSLLLLSILLPGKGVPSVSAGEETYVVCGS